MVRLANLDELVNNRKLVYSELVPDNCYYVHGVAYQIIREEWVKDEILSILFYGRLLDEWFALSH